MRCVQLKRNGKPKKENMCYQKSDGRDNAYTTDEEEKKHQKYKLLCSAPERRRVPNFKMAAKMIDDLF